MILSYASRCLSFNTSFIQQSQLKTYINHRFYHVTQIALTTLTLFLPAKSLAYKYIEPKEFVSTQSTHILRTLDANDHLIALNRRVSNQMTRIIQSDMVQGMATGTLIKDEWEKKYMKPDVLYIYRLGQSLEERARNEKTDDQFYVMQMAEMFLGYGKHFERLKKHGLHIHDKLISPECDEHIALLSRKTSIHEFYISILTDMIPYVVFANYLLQSIEQSDKNPWIEYAKKYGDLNNKYAKEKLSAIIQVANQILANHEVSHDKAEQLFYEGFDFEEWFIRHAFSTGFQIVSSVK